MTTVEDRRTMQDGENLYQGAFVIDLGCTKLLPVRSTSLAFIAKFAYTLRGGIRIEEKAFPACNIHATTSGSWVFHGDRGVREIGAGTTVFGLRDQHFGCAHHALNPNSGIVAVLLNDAVDEEIGPLFDNPVLPLPGVGPAIERAAMLSNGDEFDSMVFEIFHWCSMQSLGDDRMRGSVVRMQRVKRFIEQNALEHIGLEQIANAVGINPFVCVRQFKQATGMTPYAYLIRCRMIEAQRLLRRTKLSIEEVANLTGFNDFASFCRSFKKYTGLTATQYRLGS